MLELQSFSSLASMALYHLLLAAGVALCVGVMTYIARAKKN
jgi:hypothetical protein